MRVLRIGILLPALLALAACGINSVPRAEETAQARWADVEAAYQRRADLIPNLEATVRGFADQESEVLTQVTEARSQATRVNLDAGDLTDPAAMEQFAEAQGELSGALSRLLVTFEAYPELRSSELFLNFQSQLEGTENRINIAIRDYNEAVRDYNTRLRTFPEAIGGTLRGSEEMELYEAVSEDAEIAPEVDFSQDG
ncbi:MAG: LemA family protein [Sphingomonadales bacterium]|nr:LemA family protein [Sphingomonadales bacterium]